MEDPPPQVLCPPDSLSQTTRRRPDRPPAGRQNNARTGVIRSNAFPLSRPRGPRRPPQTIRTRTVPETIRGSARYTRRNSPRPGPVPHTTGDHRSRSAERTPHRQIPPPRLSFHGPPAPIRRKPRGPHCPRGSSDILISPGFSAEKWKAV